MPRAPAKPQVSFFRFISPEAGELARQLQGELNCTGNQIAKKAIVALAAATERAREEIAKGLGEKNWAEVRDQDLSPKCSPS